MPLIGPPPQLTTADRDALPLADRASGTVIWNLTTSKPEINEGTAATPVWRSYLYRHATSTLVHNELTAPVTVTGNNTVIITADAVIFDGTTPVLITFYCPRVWTDDTYEGFIDLFQDGVVHSRVGQVGADGFTGAFHGEPVLVQRRITPTAGSHTYSIRASQSQDPVVFEAGAGTGGAFAPMFIRIQTDFIG